MKIVWSARVCLGPLLGLVGLTCVVACSSSSASGEAASESNAMCQATVPQGGLKGKLAGATCEYLGIPYAAPPTGPMRFMPPQPAPGWSATRDATAYGPSCFQAQNALSASGPYSEDCLSVNVFAPQEASAGPLPVMVFIHGGGFYVGSSVIYDGRALSERGPVVVVTMNYRLGPLGYLALPELDSQRPGAPSGSDGIRDQQLALRWVQSNIGTFHGDPTHVTVFGESAGGSSTCIHLVSPGSKGLAKRYLMESPVCSGPLAEINTRAQTYQFSEELAASFCSGGGDGGAADGGTFDGAAPEVLSCLRAADPAQLMAWLAPASAPGVGTNALFGGFPVGSFVPTVEGAGGVLPDTPMNLVASGKFDTNAAILAGTNANEWGLFQALVTNPLYGGSSSSTLNITTATQAQQWVESSFGASNAAQIDPLYPVTDATATQTTIDLLSDYLFRCPLRALVRAASASGTKSEYMYQYDVGPSWHSFELVPLFGVTQLSFLGAAVPSSGLTDEMLGYWTQFAATGNPNAPVDAGAPVWPGYSTATDQYLQLLDPMPLTISDLRKPQCDFWDSYVSPISM
jgi:para-nitrobenzyl esterase